MAYGSYYRYRRRPPKRYYPNLPPQKGTRVWRRREIEQLCKSGLTKYIDSVFNDPASEFVANIFRMQEVSYYTFDVIKNTPEFKKAFSDRMCAVVQKETAETFKTSWGYTRLHNDDYPKIIKSTMEALSPEAKDKLIDIFMANYDNFDSAARKRLSRLIVSWLAPNDPRNTKILSKFSRNLDQRDIFTLVAGIPDGLKNKEIQDLLKRRTILNYLTFNEESFKNDPKEHKRMIRTVAKTPSLISKLPFRMELTLEDIKGIAPAMRFKFLQAVLTSEIFYASYNFTGNSLREHVQTQRHYDDLENIIMPEITSEQMKELLFSICIKKNDEFSRWIAQYESYIQKLNTPDDPTEN